MYQDQRSSFVFAYAAVTMSGFAMGILIGWMVWGG